MELETRVQRILLVDEDESAHGSLQASVSQGAGVSTEDLEIHHAGTLRAASTRLREESFDLVLLELSGGFDRLRSVSSAAQRSGALLIATGDSNGSTDLASQMNLAMRQGARGYLPNPYQDSEALSNSLVDGLALCRQERALSGDTESSEASVARLTVRVTELQAQLGQQSERLRPPRRPSTSTYRE